MIMEQIREIYKNIIAESKYMKNVNESVERELKKTLKQQKEELPELEYEEYRDKIYQVLAVAEEESFIVGFWYAVSLLTERR